MATASLYGNNDYNALQYRPYELPINDIMKAFVAKNQFWEQGAARVKSVYESALNLDLTTEQNKKYKEEFMLKAQEEMKKLSSMDLGDADVQKQGMSIFSPLLKDKMIAIDDQLTKRRKAIFQEAEAYKTKKLSKDGIEGEGYNSKNLAYALEGFEQFNSQTPRDEKTLTELYNKLGNKSYTPAYDLTSEFTKVKKLCEGQSITNQHESPGNYLYFERDSKTGASSSEMALCFQRGLSPQAKQQMGIDGWAHYKSNPGQLYDDFKDQFLNGLDVEEQALEGKIAGIKAGTIKLQPNEKLSKLEELLSNTKELKTNKLKEFDAMTGPDGESYIMKNFDRLSAQVYSNNEMKALGFTFKNEDIRKELLANTAGIAQYNAHQRYMLQERASELRKGEMLYQAQLDGTLISDSPDRIQGNITDTPDLKYTTEQFANDRSKSFDSYSGSYQSIAQYLQKQFGKGKVLNDAFILNYANEQMKKLEAKQEVDSEFLRLFNDYKSSKENFESIDMKGKMIDSMIENEMGTDYKEFMKKSVKLTDGTIITGKDILDSPIIKTKGPDDKVENEMVRIKGKEYNLKYTNSNQDVSRIKSLYNDNNEIFNKSQKRKEEILTKQFYNAGDYVSPRLDIGKNDALSNRITGILGLSAEGNAHNKKNGFRLLGHDGTGKDMYVIPLDEEGKEITDKKKLEEFTKRASGMQNSTEVKYVNGIPTIEIKGLLNELPNLPSPQAQKNITKLRDFSELISQQFKNKDGYVTSYDLKDKYGNPTQYPEIYFKGADGKDIRVSAVKANGKILLKPEKFTGSKWDKNYPSFETAENLVLHFNQ